LLCLGGKDLVRRTLAEGSIPLRSITERAANAQIRATS
jgi:hypothetical protein